MAARVRAHDWSATPLGPVEAWPQELKAAAMLVLDTRFPAALVWGEGMTTLHNDGFIAILGNKPAALGSSFADIWAEAWDEIRPIVRRAYAGEPSYHEDFALLVDRSGRMEQAYFTFAYSPIRAADGAIVGMIDIVTETTGSVQARKEISDSEARFRAFAAASADVVYRMSPDWSEMRQLEGRSFLRDTDEPSDDWLSRYIHPDDRPMVHAAIDQAIRAKATFELEHRVIREDGTLGWTLSRAVPILNEDAEIAEWLGAASDITAAKAMATARTQAERALLESERRQAFQLELSDALRALADPAEIQNVAMRALGDYLGVTRAQYYEPDPTTEYLTTAGGYSSAAPPVLGRVRLDDLGPYVGEAFRTGRTVAVADVALDPRVSAAELAAYDALGVRAFVGIPLIKDGRFVVVIGLHHATPRVWSEADLALAAETAERTWAAVEHARAEAALRQSEARLAAIFEILPVGVAIGNADGRFVLMNAEMRRFTPSRPMPLDDPNGLSQWRANDADGHRIPQEDFPAVRALRGEPTMPGLEMLYTDDDGRELWTSVSAVPITDGAGAVIGQATVVNDIDDLRQLQGRQEVLVAELQHRVRNILAVVRSVFSRTIEVGEDLAEVADHFQGRLDALARTQVIVTRSADRMVDLEDLLREELLSIGVGDGPGVTIEGPEVRLPAKAAETLGLALHELATNALKYGALKVVGAHLTVSWEIHLGYGGARSLHLRWTEQGVPAIAVRPSREGFGRELIEEALPYRLGAETKLEFRGGGVRCSISFALPADGENMRADAEDS